MDNFYLTNIVIEETVNTIQYLINTDQLPIYGNTGPTGPSQGPIGHTGYTGCTGHTGPPGHGDTGYSGPTGPGGISKNGENYSDYLFWNSNKSLSNDFPIGWDIGNSEIHIGSFAGEYTQGYGAIAVGY